MKNFKRESIDDWSKISKLYTVWVSKTYLRKYFSDNLLLDNFSIWWSTDICNKDNVITNKWFTELKSILIEKKKIKIIWSKFYILFFLKYFKNFIYDICWYFILKLTSYTRFSKIKKKNCFHSFNYNFLKSGNYYMDRCYSKAIFKNSSQNFYLINNIKRKDYILSLFKKKKFLKKIPILMADEYISSTDVVKVYFKTILMFFKLDKELKKKENIFVINKINCESILKPLLLMSFAGSVQKSILFGQSIKKSLEKKEIKRFINYIEFNPFMRSIYFYVRELKQRPKIITIQHGAANNNLLFFLHTKNEFTTNKYNEGRFFSPSPDIYLVQGKYFKNLLSTYFSRLIYIIGSLKYDLISLNKKYSISYKKKPKKKILLICPSIGDEKLILSFFEKCNVSNYRLVLSPHPTYKKQTIKLFKEKLKDKFEIEIYNNVTTNDLLPVSDLVVCSMSTIGYEALFYNVTSMRIIDKSKPPFFDDTGKLPVIDNSSDFNNILNEKVKFKVSKKKLTQIKKFFFYKLDQKAYKRFWLIINKN